ncbi:MAG: chorismate synthase [Clostridia bacterium]|nr:chorismate synthase [Clostridia bacterium]
MKNTFGNSITITLFGESHGEQIGAVLDGVPSGILVDIDYIKNQLSKRRPFGCISTGRVEKDEFSIVSGVFNGYTTGTPICLLIPNSNTSSKDYDQLKYLPRPSHADYTANIKYNGFQDYRGGGHFSGRITAALVAVGAILQRALEEKGIYVASHISLLRGIKDKSIDGLDDLVSVNCKAFPVIDDDVAVQMQKEIENAGEQGDSVGGVLETVVLGLPAGIGEPWFDSLESLISHAMFSIPGIKGVEFGAGFSFANGYGSQMNDAFVLEGDQVRTKTNNNGGINGGISNGMPIVFRSVVKPTPSIYKEQQTVNLNTMQEQVLEIKGRHDPAIIHRARAVVNALTAITIADALAVKFGTDFLNKING